MSSLVACRHGAVPVNMTRHGNLTAEGPPNKFQFRGTKEVGFRGANYSHKCCTITRNLHVSASIVLLAPRLCMHPKTESLANKSVSAQGCKEPRLRGFTLEGQSHREFRILLTIDLSNTARLCHCHFDCKALHRHCCCLAEQRPCELVPRIR